jgi:hypothetical protein
LTIKNSKSCSIGGESAGLISDPWRAVLLVRIAGAES